jgi:Hypoxia induced protein conserved region
MEPFSKSVILLAMVAIAVVLALGLFNMAKGGSMSTSQKLMRWRVGLQFIAICIIMTAIYFASH